MAKQLGDIGDDSSEPDLRPVSSDEQTVTTQGRAPRVIDAVERFFASPPESSESQPSSAATAPAVVVRGTDLPRPWGRYELRRSLGRGSFGEVFCAWDPELEWEIAIKILHDERNLLPEGRALAQFKDCAHIVKVLSLEKHEGRVGLCMELIDGEPLDQLVRDFGSFSAAEATATATAVAQAAGAIHHKHFVHRDIKAQNVMRERAGRIVLMDFGAGRRVEGLSREDSIGTALYMAPELFEGALPSYSTDIYSIGVLMFFIVTQKYPVQAQTMDGLKMAHRAGRRRLLGDERPDLPQQFVRIVDRATAADPEARYQSIAPLLRDLDELNTKNARPTPLQRLAMGAGITLIGLVVVTVLGFINTVQFNVMFETSGSMKLDLGDWVTWGFRSLPLPLALATEVVIAVAGIATLVRYLRSWRPGVDRRLQSWSATIRQARRRLRLDRPCEYAQFMFLLALLYLGGFVALFHQYVGAVFNNISALTPEQRYLLAQSNGLMKAHYETLLVYPIVGLAWGLYRFVRLRRLHPSDGAVPYAVGMGALLLTYVVLLEAPYRVFFQANDFRRVTYAKQACFDLNRDPTQPMRLVYCPEPVASNVVRVAVDNPQLVAGNETEVGNPFGP